MTGAATSSSARNPNVGTPRRALFRLLGVALGLVLGVAFAEVVLRLLPAREGGDVYLNKNADFAWDCYSSNPRGYFEAKTLDDGRVIYCVDHAEDPPREELFGDLDIPGHYKILAVGDSFTWGLGVRGGDAWPYVAGELIEAETNVPVAVANHAHVGRNVAEVAAEFVNAVKRGGLPDLTVYGYVLNDPLEGRESRATLVAPSEKAEGMDSAHVDDGINIRSANLEQLRLQSPFAGLRRYSKVVDTALSAYENRRIASATLNYYRELHDPKANAAGLSVAWSEIERMRRIAERDGRRFLLVVWPIFLATGEAYPFREIHDYVVDQCRSRDIDCLDLEPAFRGEVAEELWVHPVDRHPNEKAHKIAALAVSKYIVDQGWVSAAVEDSVAKTRDGEGR